MGARASGDVRYAGASEFRDVARVVETCPGPLQGNRGTCGNGHYAGQ